MKLESQVVNLELAQKLKELGVKQESHFYYVWLTPKTNPQKYKICERPYSWIEKGGTVENYWSCDFVSAFTVAELGEILKGVGNTFYSRDDKVWKCSIPVDIHDKLPTFNFYKDTEADTEADARAKCLIYLIENKLITI